MLHYVEVPGKVARTSTGHVRITTLRAIIRRAREIAPQYAEYSATEVIFQADDFDPERLEPSRVTFDTDKPAAMGAAVWA